MCPLTLVCCVVVCVALQQLYATPASTPKPLMLPHESKLLLEGLTEPLGH